MCSDIIPAPVRNRSIKIATAYFAKCVAYSLPGLIDKRKSLVPCRDSSTNEKALFFEENHCSVCFFLGFFPLDFDEDANILSLPCKNDTPRMRQENNRDRFGKRRSRNGPYSTIYSFFSPPHHFCKNRKITTETRKPGYDVTTGKIPENPGGLAAMLQSHTDRVCSAGCGWSCTCSQVM